MKEESEDSTTEDGHRENHNPPHRLVYVMPESGLSLSMDNEISLRRLWNAVWRGRRLIILVGIVVTTLSAAYALLATEWYRAETLLVPAESDSSPGLASQLGGLAGLAGINLAGDGGGTVEPLAVLRSREFARDFISDFDLVSVFFADEWDSEANRWLNPNSEKWPDIRDAVKFFHDNILQVAEHDRTGLVSVSVQWTDPEVAASWASSIVQRLNDRMRQRALKEAEKNVAYLQSLLADTHLVTIQQSIGRILESELQKLMLARGNEEFSFRVIDPAVPPKEQSHPKRLLIVVLGGLLGGVVGLFMVLVTHMSPRANNRAVE